MNVASLELCKELCKLSGWKDTDYFHQFIEYSDLSTGYYLTNPTVVAPLHANAYPAYDLGFLLRKFKGKGGVELRYGDKGCIATSHMASTGSNTPEDAVARLAIELFRQGILNSD